MRLTPRHLNRTLLRRQHLLERVTGSAYDEVGHLIGLQAQDNRSPYLSLAARLATFDPETVSRGLEDRTLVRLLTLRGTVHLLRADDAVRLRPWTQERMEKQLRSSPAVGPARTVERAGFDDAVRTALADGPLPLRELSAALATSYAGVAPAALGNLARAAAALVQLPPRGCWKRSGGVVNDLVDRWVDLPLSDPDDAWVEGVVRRYLRAFGPATAADVAAWSGVTRLGPAVAAMEDLVRHEDEDGRTLLDVAEGEIADGDTPSPVRMLGTYDNLWLGHARRDRVTETGNRARWMGANGGTGCVVLVDGWLEGLWRAVDGRVEILETMRTLTRAERAGLDEEIVKIESLLAR